MTAHGAKARIGVVGLGIMGLAIAKNAKKAGYPVVVYNRGESRRKEAASAGLEIAANPRTLAEKVDAILVIVTDPAAVRNVLNGPDGLLAGAAPGKTFIQSSTIDPVATAEFAAAAAAKGLRFLDCPVTGSRKQVEEGQLILLAGGDPALVDQWTPFLLTIGKAVVKAGPVGKGTALKLCMNLIVAQMTTALCEAVALARLQDLDPAHVFEVIAASPALNCGYFKIKEGALLNDDFRPAFSLDNMLKDVRFMDDTATRAGHELPVTRAVRVLMETASAAGLGAEDLTALVKALAPAASRAGR